MKLQKKWKFVVAVLVLLSAVYLTHPLYLKALGNFLVVSDPLVKSDAIVVLDGDPMGERLLHSVQLWRSGYAPKVILSARVAEWQTYEDYPSWRHARKLKMLPEDALLVATHNADSTREEAQYFLRFVRQQGFKKVIIVTSNYHTWRTKRVYDKEWKDGDVLFYISPAYSSQFHPDEWWKHRADSRTFFYEFSKIIWYTLAE